MAADATYFAYIMTTLVSDCQGLAHSFMRVFLFLLCS